ncbi:hypothetical protein AB6A40_008581 [Gnathostoma spinigerum]|uniref:Sex-determining region Y protein n=1 Tax=Gnathostoma spinigerum TaxID=75299 RepID=A0ABD6EYU1_9BILA
MGSSSVLNTTSDANLFDTKESTPKTAPRKCSEYSASGERIKRPMNAFMVWSQIRRAQIANQDGKIHNSQISKELGVEWRSMLPEEKAPYMRKAKELRENLMKEHPDYVYRPKRRNRVKSKSVSVPAKPTNPVQIPARPSCSTSSSPLLAQNPLITQQYADHLLAAAVQRQQLLLLAAAYQTELAAAAGLLNGIMSKGVADTRLQDGPIGKNVNGSPQFPFLPPTNSLLTQSLNYVGSVPPRFPNAMDYSPQLLCTPAKLPSSTNATVTQRSMTKDQLLSV